MPMFGFRAKSVPNVARDTLAAYQPTLRDRAAKIFLQATGDTYQAQRLAENIFGSSGLGGTGFGLGDLTPMGSAFAADEGGRKIAKGNIFSGLGDVALAAIPVPSAAKGVRGLIGGASRRAEQVAESAASKISAFHGSPHAFTKFDAAKIGTGEGGQAYGRGLYFAENEAVARQYRDALSSDAQGHMYKVDINADPNDFLDWDAPVNRQGPKVREALAKLLDDESLRTAQDANIYDAHSRGVPFDPRRGETVYRGLGPKREATKALQEAGIPGIKYRDQGSRTGNGPTTRNFVVFDPRVVDIMKRYGVAGPVAATMLASGLYGTPPANRSDAK